MRICWGGAELHPASPPNVLVADIKLPDGNGFNLTEAARSICPSLRILILTAVDDADAMRKAAKLGIQGYSRKTAPLSRLVDAIRSVANGATVYDLNTSVSRDDRPDLLTERELAVLELVAIGCRNWEIAERLRVSLKTAEFHVASILARLGVRSRVEAIAAARARGILTK
ncbi:MAG: LuxR C-terminal-related transcriptional regulator [Chloroflexota bacterium]